MIKEVTYYEIHCDEDGCRERPDDIFSGWSDQDVAEESAREAEWSTDGNGKHWCPSHWPTCPPGEHVRPNSPDEACWRCRQWPEDDEDEVAATQTEGNGS